MRIAVLFGVIGLAGCSRPAAIEAPPVDTAPAVAQEAPAPRPAERPSHVPQNASNLRELEDTRRFGDGVEKDLAEGRFKHGARIAEVIAAYKPDALFDHGPYTTAVYAEVRGNYLGSMGHGTYLIAKEGRMVYAFGRSCIWRPVFFDSLTNAERSVWYEGYWAARKTYVESLTPDNLRRTAAMTVAGPAAVSPSTPIPQPAPEPREIAPR